MTNWPVHARIDGPIVMIGFGSIGRGTLPLIERHFTFDKSRFVGHRSRGQRPQAARRARHPLHPAGRHQGQLPRAADAAAHRRRRPGLLRQPLGRHLLGRHHGALQRDRRALHRHRRRAVAGLLFRHQARAGGALELRAARDDARRQARAQARRRPPPSPAAAPIPAWCRGSSSRRCSTSPATSAQVQRAEDARGLGAGWRKQARRQGHPHRRARHPARQAAEAAATCSSTPGRSRASCRKACSRPSSAGARTRSGCRRTAASTRPAARPRSI